MTKYQSLADVLAAIAFCADEAARSVANLDHPESFPDSLGEMRARAARDTSVLLDLMDMPVEYAAMMADLDGRNEQAATPLLATETTDQPALQPVLARDDVTKLLKQIAHAQNDAQTTAREYREGGDDDYAERAYSYADGLVKAYEMLNDTWLAAVVTADMLNNPEKWEE